MTNYEKVKTFMKTFGQEVKEKAEFPDKKIINLRIKLIEEEFKELKDAISNNDIVEVADALTDILVVTYGGGLAFGIDLETHEKLVAEARLDPALDEATMAYRASLETALIDGMITPDEEAILATLRATLEIPETRHATLLAEILDRND